MIKERPILMSAPMVRAILDRQKTQTRRIVKSKNDLSRYTKAVVISKEEYNEEIAPELCTKIVAKKPMALFARRGINNLDIECPYGNVGDRLWVRESFKKWCIDGTDTIEDGWWTVRYRADNNIRKHCATWDCCATDDSPTEVGCVKAPARWTPSIHMPRWASRILLEITAIRVERLQDISDDDAIAEGILFNGDYDLWWDYQREQWICVDPIDSYKSLICKINGPETWERNPWVWVVEFKVREMKGGSHENL